MESIKSIWFQQPIPYVSLLAFLLAALLALWVFYAASQRGIAAIPWKVLTLIGTLLILPSVVLGVLPDVKTQYDGFLAILGIVGAVITITGALGFLVAPGQPQGIDMSYRGAGLGVQDAAGQAEPALQATTPIAEPPSPPGDFPAPGPISEGTVILKKESPTLAWLVVRSGPHMGKDFRLSHVTKIGRDSTLCQVTIDDVAMSREHASIRLADDGDFYVTDLDSSNGVFVNDKRVYRERLANGDALRLGETTLVFMRLEEKNKQAVD